MTTRTAAAALILASVLATAAQAAPAVPRAADGHADLTGVWTNASVTKLTRQPGLQLTLNEAEARAMAKSNPMVRRSEIDAQPIDPKTGAPPPGDPQGYNAFWLDAGSTYARVKGQYRTS